MKEKRAQAFGFDLFIAIGLFLAAFILIYFYSINLQSSQEKVHEALSYDGNVIADSLLSEGYPQNWDKDNVVIIGILSNNKINETKLSKFNDLANSDYNKAKNIFNTKYNFYVNLTEPIINEEDEDEEEITGIGLPPSSPKNLIKLTRFTIYKDKPVTLIIELWN